MTTASTPPLLRALVTAPMRGPGLERLHELAQVVHEPWIDQQPMRLHTPAELAARLRAEDARVLICEADPCQGPVLDEPLLAIGSTRGDPTNVDVPAATARGIPVLHAPGRNADAVAELTVGLLLAASRRLVAADADVRAGEIYREGSIPYQRFRGWQIAGRTAGLVGLGAIGRAVRWRLEGLGMRVHAYDPYADDATASLEQVLQGSDVVSMHAPVTPETKGMIDREALASMREGAVYLNAARADLHDPDALVDALRTGHLAAAGLDHFEGEFLAPDHPLAALDNVVLTPHIGGATYDTEANHSVMIVDDLARLLAGEQPRHCVNPEVLR